MALHVKLEVICEVFEVLRVKGYMFMVFVYGVDYFLEELCLGVQYELLDMKEVDCIVVKFCVFIGVLYVFLVMFEWLMVDY